MKTYIYRLTGGEQKLEQKLSEQKNALSIVNGIFSHVVVYKHRVEVDERATTTRTKIEKEMAMSGGESR